jgi:RNA polymerase sigma factor FliA
MWAVDPPPSVGRAIEEGLTLGVPHPTGADATQALIEQHLYLVQHVLNHLARRYPRHVERGDLWSAGAQGLVEAALRYDPGTGVPFPRYAVVRIRGAMVDCTRERDMAARGLRRHERLARAAREDFEAAHGRAPSAEELAAILGKPAAEVYARQCAAAALTVLRLDLPARGRGGQRSTLAERLQESHPDALPQEALEQREVVGTLRLGLAHLDPVHREVIERHYFGDELLRDIAADRGCTEARISQLRNEALHALQAYFATAYDGVPPVPHTCAGVRRRTRYVAELARRSTWRTRLRAADASGLGASGVDARQDEGTVPTFRQPTERDLARDGPDDRHLAQGPTGRRRAEAA